MELRPASRPHCADGRFGPAPRAITTACEALRPIEAPLPSRLHLHTILVMRLISFFLGLAALSSGTLPVHAITRGEVARDPNGVRASVVRVESSRGELCSGAVIAPDLVLTAAHCVLERASYHVVGVDRRFRTQAVPAVAAAMHPAFVAGTTPRTQPGIDLAILKLARPLGPEFVPLDIRYTGSIGSGEPVKLAGFGITGDGRSSTARTLRQTYLVALGTLQVGNRVTVVADGERLARAPGAGACRGDSGGPILRGGPGGYQILGVVSWSSGALNTRGSSACGGLTAVTPVAENASWIAARSQDLNRLAPGEAIRNPRAPANPVDWVAR